MTETQDIIFFIGSLIFVIALVPAIFAREKPPRSTCAMTAVVLYVFAATYVSLDFTLSAVITAVTATCWAVLLFQPRNLIGSDHAHN